MNEGKRIRARREALGLSQVELAKRLGVSPSTVNIVESDRDGITTKRLEKYAKALGCSIEDLMNDIDVENIAKHMHFVDYEAAESDIKSPKHKDTPAIENLTPNERLIVERYRMLPQKDKAALLGQILTYEPSSERKEGTL